MSNDKALETSYLQEVYGELVDTKRELSEMLESATTEGLLALKAMGEDIRLNHDNISDNLDTFATLEMKNREIDQMNIRLRSAEAELKKVKTLLNVPYFGKVNINFLDEDPSSDFYIGVSSFTNKEGTTRIYDWRSPISELFYNNELGKSSYSVNNNTIAVEINKRRQFIIDKDQLIKFFDTSIAIQDDLLLEALERDSLSHMRDITSTIQKEQNVIIRDTSSPVILVNGIAGSGKTSTIMQRVAYLLYLLQQKITSDNILILSPNHRFIDYVSDVLPSLGEKNPLNLTLLQFVQNHLTIQMEEEATYFSRIIKQEVDLQTKQLREKPFIDFIKHSDQLLIAEPDFFKDIVHNQKIIISKKKMLEIYQSTPDYPCLIDKIQATKKRLNSYWESHLMNQAKSRRIQDQILSLTEDAQQKYFGKLLSNDSEATISRYGKILLKKKYRQVTKKIEENKWIDAQKIVEDLYERFSGQKFTPHFEGKRTLDEGVILLTVQHTFIEKINLPKMNFVLIDEVQDYNYAQLSLLLDLFPKTEFTLVGDENQAIFNSTIAFQSIEHLFNKHGHNVKRYDLLSSYRSSGAITKVFRELAENNEKMTIVPIRPDGNQPQILEFCKVEDFLNIVTKIVIDQKVVPLTIITKSEEEAKELSILLEKTPLLESSNIRVQSISLSKGLEFDHVLIYDVSKEKYFSKRDKRILYTSISRAMQNLYITYRGEISPFIQPINS